VPHIDITSKDILEGASFRLVEAIIRWDDHTCSSGWGRDALLETARWKAINEAIERHSFTRLPSVVRAAAQSLQDWLHPDRLIRYSNEQHVEAALCPFHVSDIKHWALMRPVLSDVPASPVHVLADFLCSPRAFSAEDRERLLVYASTSGCASADSIDLAILRATMELIERDAFMRHWFSQASGRSIDLKTLTPDLLQRVRALEQYGCEVGLQWLDLGVHPTWLAWAQHEGQHFTSIGSASGIDGMVAVNAAFNELETAALSRAEGIPVEMMRPEAVQSPADHGALYATPEYFRRADTLLRGAEGHHIFVDALRSFEASPNEIYMRLARHGHMPYWIDLSVPGCREILGGISIHTVRVIAPDLIPMVFGYGRMPLGMDAWGRTGVDDLHPFT